MMGFGNMMGYIGPYWATLFLLLMVILFIGVVLTIVGIIRYSENNKDKQLIIWGVVALLVPIIVWGIAMTLSSNNFSDSNNKDKDESSSMMNY